MSTSSSGHSALLVSRLGILVDDKYARFYHHVYHVDQASLFLTHLLFCFQKRKHIFIRDATADLGMME
jgi:hypothetical protein